MGVPASAAAAGGPPGRPPPHLPPHRRPPPPVPRHPPAGRRASVRLLPPRARRLRRRRHPAAYAHAPPPRRCGRGTSTAPRRRGAGERRRLHASGAASPWSRSARRLQVEPCRRAAVRLTDEPEQGLTPGQVGDRPGPGRARPGAMMSVRWPSCHTDQVRVFLRSRAPGLLGSGLRPRACRTASEPYYVLRVQLRGVPELEGQVHFLSIAFTIACSSLLIRHRVCSVTRSPWPIESLQHR
jgi:hypothetical protein